VLGKFVVFTVGEKLVDLLGRRNDELVVFIKVRSHPPPAGPDNPDNMAGQSELFNITPPSALDNAT
jgi:hypothetical protein